MRYLETFNWPKVFCCRYSIAVWTTTGVAAAHCCAEPPCKWGMKRGASQDPISPERVRHRNPTLQPPSPNTQQCSWETWSSPNKLKGNFFLDYWQSELWSCPISSWCRYKYILQEAVFKRLIFKPNSFSKSTVPLSEPIPLDVSISK